jgi:hypothetical protein
MATALQKPCHTPLGVKVVRGHLKMLNILDNVIDKIFDSDWTAPPAKPDRSFAIPDDTFRNTVSNLTLNIYLTEIRENPAFRRASWDTIPLPDRTTVLSRPPSYFDCHYLISAWSAIQQSDIASGAADEHAALGGALRVLLRNPDVNPGALGVSGGGTVFQGDHIYFTLSPPDAPRVVHDFWNTMQLPWRPAISLIATAPLDPAFDSPPTQPMVTLVQRFGSVDGAPDSFEELIAIGGLVLRNAGGAPITGATVLRTATGEQVTTDSQGRFSFGGLLPGRHHFRASATGFTAIERDVTVPNGPPATHIFRLS